MPLITVQAVTWKSNRPEKYKRGNGHTYYVAYGDYYMLNTNRMVDIVDSPDGVGTVFKYAQSPNDHRVSLDTIETNTPLNQLRNAHDDEPDHKFGVFPIFPTLDITRVTTDTPVDTEIEWNDICMVYQTPRDYALDVAHMIYYDKSFKRRRVIIDMNLNEVTVEQENAV